VAGRNEDTMYTGTLIDDLLATVERGEQRAQQSRSQEEKLAHVYAISPFELTQNQLELAGVA
jgi:hypothetical protein